MIKRVLAAILFINIAYLAILNYSEASPVRFREGQLWSIKSASQENAKIIIGRIEDWNGQSVVHISVIDLIIPKGLQGAGQPMRISHMPFENNALVDSVSTLIADQVPPAPGFDEGLKLWRSDKKAGIYAVSLSTALKSTIDAMSRSQQK